MSKRHRRQDRSFGALLEHARRNAELTQAELSERAGTTNRWISRLEAGAELPSLELLSKLRDSSHSDTHLSVWLLKWAQASLQSSTKLEEDRKASMQREIEQAVNRLSRRMPETWPQLGRPRSLSDFPFEPLTVVCGDRREPAPKTRGDLFAYSVSITDLMFLPCLGLDIRDIIRSDKPLAFMGADYLENKLGRTNLLIIGSPAVNLVAREVNKRSLFRFVVEEDVLEFQQRLDDPKMNVLNDRKNLALFANMILTETPDHIDAEAFIKDHSSEERARVEQLASLATSVLNGQDAKYWMNQFRRPGIIDPVARRVQARSPREDNDFAVISMAPNPWEARMDAQDPKQRYVAILVAGIHGPGTAHALKILTDKEQLDSHPFGGILEVQLDLLAKNWPDRFEEATVQWQTPPYAESELVSNLKQQLRDHNSGRETNFPMREQEIKDCLHFLGELAGGPTPT